MTPISANMRNETRKQETRKIIRQDRQDRREAAPVYNEETRRAISEARRGIGLTETYRSAAELFAALDAEDAEDVVD